MESQNNNGVGFCGILTIVFVTLKIIGVIDWSWIWVLSPVWIPLCLGILFAAIIIIKKL